MAKLVETTYGEALFELAVQESLRLMNYVKKLRL